MLERLEHCLLRLKKNLSENNPLLCSAWFAFCLPDRCSAPVRVHGTKSRQALWSVSLLISEYPHAAYHHHSTQAKFLGLKPLSHLPSPFSCSLSPIPDIHRLTHDLGDLLLWSSREEQTFPFFGPLCNLKLCVGGRISVKQADVMMCIDVSWHVISSRIERFGAGGGLGVFTGLSSLDLTDIWLKGMILNVGKHTSQSLGCMYVSLSFTYLSLSINSEVSCFSLSQQASLSKETTWDLLEIQLNVQYLVSSPKNLMVPFPVLKSIYPG